MPHAAVQHASPSRVEGAALPALASVRMALGFATATILVIAPALLAWPVPSAQLFDVAPAYRSVAPVAALCLALLGASVILETRRGSHTLAGAISFLVAAGASVHLGNVLAGRTPALDVLFRRPLHVLGEVPVSRMAPLAAVALLLASLSLLCLARKTRASALGSARVGLALAVHLIGAVGALGYLFGAPLLYGGLRAPMAFPTAVGLAFLGLALIGISRADAAPIRPFVGPSPRSRLLRALLPVAPVIVLTELVFAQIDGLNPALDAALTALLSALAVGGVVFYATRGVGRQLHATVLESETKLRALFDSDVVGIGFGDVTGGIVDANAAFCRIVAYTRDDLSKGLSWSALTPPEFVPQDMACIAQARASGTCAPYEKQIIRKDGTRRWVLMGYVLLEPERQRTVAVVLDIDDRKRVQESLQRSEREQTELVRELAAEKARLVDAQALAKVGSWEMELPSRAVTWSAETYRVFERRPADGPPRSSQDFLEHVHPDDRAAVAQRFSASTGPGSSAHRLLMPDGRIKFVEARWETVFDADGRAVRAIGTNRDVTEQRLAEEALRASLEEFRVLAEALPQMVWIAGADGANTFVNGQWVAYTGLTAAESLGPGWIEPFHPDDRERTREAWTRATETGGIYSVECRLRRTDGVYRWWLIRAVPMAVAHDSVLKWFGTCTDIDDLKVALLAVSASEERFAKVFESSLVAIGIAEMSSGRLIDVNERCAEFFGYSRAEMIGRSALDLGLWADLADRDRLMATIAAGGSTDRREMTFRRPSGEIRHALASIESTTAPGIEGKLLLWVLMDVTVHRQLESQLLQSQKMEAVGRLAGGVAHDFNNSLGVILGYTELLLRGASEAQRGKLEQILKATHSATSLTRQLLAFSRKQVIDPKVLDLNGLVADVEKMLGRLIGEDIDLAIIPGPGLGQVKADPGQLEQVVMNLCVNARDAMPGGGLLRIETANAELDAGSVTLHGPMQPGPYVMLAITDTGSGIPKEILANIFEPFFTTKEEGKGTGLGLSMVYGIVQQAEGHIWVYSEVGIGTTFKVYLPRIDQAASAEVPELPMAASGSETLLLVEDEAPLREIAREILEEHGYRVIEAASGLSALEMAARHGQETIHLLVSDVIMPGMNGRELAHTLVAARPDLRVLYMSGYTDDIVAQSGVLEAGTFLLEKPFTARALLGRVRTALDAVGAGAKA